MMSSRASHAGINRALGNFYILCFHFDINLLKVVLGNSVSCFIKSATSSPSTLHCLHLIASTTLAVRGLCLYDKLSPESRDLLPYLLYVPPYHCSILTPLLPLPHLIMSPLLSLRPLLHLFVITLLKGVCLYVCGVCVCL